MIEVTTLTQLAVFLLASGTPGMVVSWLAENVPAFQALSKGWKIAALLLIAFLFGGIAVAIQWAVAGVPETSMPLLNTLFYGVFYAVVFLLGSQFFHVNVNQRSKANATLRAYLKNLPASLRAAGVTNPTWLAMAEALAALVGALQLPGEEAPVGTLQDARIMAALYDKIE